MAESLKGFVPLECHTIHSYFPSLLWKIGNLNPIGSVRKARRNMDTETKVRLCLVALSIGLCVAVAVFGLSVHPLDPIGGSVPG